MSEPIVSVQPWQPNVDAAVHALHDRGVISLKPEFREMHLRDVQVVLEASGAIEEVQRLRALLHAAHFALDTLRTENAALLEVALQATTSPVDLAAGILRKIAEPTEAAELGATVADEIAAPGHVDGWQTSAELISDPGPDVLSEVVADMAKAENEATWSRIGGGR